MIERERARERGGGGEKMISLVFSWSDTNLNSVLERKKIEKTKSDRLAPKEIHKIVLKRVECSGVMFSREGEKFTNLVRTTIFRMFAMIPKTQTTHERYPWIG